jgi:hypothetical protein
MMVTFAMFYEQKAYRFIIVRESQMNVAHQRITPCRFLINDINYLAIKLIYFSHHFHYVLLLMENRDKLMPIIDSKEMKKSRFA